MSKPALYVELAERNRKIEALRGEVIKQQLVGAVRLDVIRLLGFISNRDPAPDIETIVPDAPEVRAVMARELRNLAEHLREQAAAFDKHAEQLKLANEAEAALVAGEEDDVEE